MDVVVVVVAILFDATILYKKHTHTYTYTNKERRNDDQVAALGNDGE